MLAFVGALAFGLAAADTTFYGLRVLPYNTSLAQADVSYLEDGQLAVGSSDPVYMYLYDNTTASIGDMPLGVSSDSYPVIDSSAGNGGWSVKTLDAAPYSDVSILVYNGVFQFWVCANAQGQAYGTQGASGFPLAVGRAAPAGCINPQAVYLQANDYTGYFESLSSQYAAASTSLWFSYTLTGVYSATTTAGNINSLVLETDASTLTPTTSSSTSSASFTEDPSIASSSLALTSAASSRAVYASATTNATVNTTNAGACAATHALPPLALLAFVL